MLISLIRAVAPEDCPVIVSLTINVPIPVVETPLTFTVGGSV